MPIAVGIRAAAIRMPQHTLGAEDICCEHGTASEMLAVEIFRGTGAWCAALWL